jgi:hypothetical protein
LNNLILEIRIAVLWIFMAVASMAHYIIVSPEQSQIFQSITEQPGTLLFWSIFLLIPLVMAFLSVTLKDALNRKTNLSVGIIFTILNVFHLFGCPVARSSGHQILLVLSTVVVTALIVWYAWKWSKK